MKDRINKLIEQEGLTPAEFADRIGVQRSSVSHVINGRNNPGFSFIQKILETYKNVNPRWLLIGEGSIYESQNQVKPKQVKEPTLFQNNDISEEKTVDSSVKKEANELTFDNNEKTTNNIVDQYNIKSKNKKVTRVLLFFDDRSFEDFYPAE